MSGEKWTVVDSSMSTGSDNKQNTAKTSFVGWLLLVVGIITWTFTGVVLTGIAYLIWPEPRALWQEYVANFCAFIPLFVHLLITPKLMGMPVRTAFTYTPTFRWKFVWLGMWTWGLLLICETVVKMVTSVNRLEVTFRPETFLPTLLVSLILLPIQTASEEMLFRGVLSQNLSRHIRQPIVVAMLSSVLFGAAHLMNPEALSRPIISLLAYSAVGFGWGWVTHKSGGLELAIGAHTINNFYGLFVVGYRNSAITGSSIWMLPNINMVESMILSVIMAMIWVVMLGGALRDREVT
jgi:membrane protease YdiL (CAAX protease family)